MATKRKTGVQRIKLEGEVTIYNAADLKNTILAALTKHNELEIDLAGVSELDSAGMQLLLLAKREALGLKRPLRLINHSAATLELFELYHIADYFADPAAMPRNDN